jgi:hypothetical protein
MTEGSKPKIKKRGGGGGEQEEKVELSRKKTIPTLLANPVL